MHVFVTGSTGWVGAAVVDELLAHGHSVVGLSRSKDKGDLLRAKGADVLLGTLEDLDNLHAAANSADAVAHLGFNHDFTRYVENAALDQRVIETIGRALQGTDKPLLVSSTLSSLRVHGRVATEQDLPASDPTYPRRSEEAARRLSEHGVMAGTVRLPSSIHGVGETHGFVPILVNLARRSGVSAYLGDGTNRWLAVHVSDAARLYRLALESGATQRAYHAVGEGAVAFRDLAVAIGEKLGLPVEPRAAEHFGGLAGFVGEDLLASNERTRQVLNWQPTGPGLVADIRHPDYYAGG